MKNKIFRYLKEYSMLPLEVDRLIISAYIEANGLTVTNNKLLLHYFINKSQDKEYNSLQDFIHVIKQETNKFSIEDLIELFEFVISPSDRVINGAVYTPEHIRDFIVQNAFLGKEQQTNISAADIACGCGGFLFSCAKKLKQTSDLSYIEIFEKHIFGLDIQEYAITRSKLLLTLLALQNGEESNEINFNLFVGDSLSFKWSDNVKAFCGFSIIVGNPPYVRLRSLNQETKLLLKNWEVCSTGLTDLYIPFFQIGYQNLVQNGTLGYITMNSFFKSLNGRALRKYFQDNNVAIKIIDFGADQVFMERNTYVCICFLDKQPQNHIDYVSVEGKNLSENLDFGQVNYRDLNSKKGWNLKNNNKVSAIEKTGTPFGELYKTRHGIATLKNDIYIFSPLEGDQDYLYLQNEQRYAIERGICREIVNSNKLSRIKELRSLKETVIFPYIHCEGKVEIMPEEMIRDLYPNAYLYLRQKKNILSKRDNGKGKDYKHWYAYGRTQSLEKMKHKLFFPKFSDVTPSYIINHDENLMFYNGLALIGDNEFDIEIARKIMESKVFWYYIVSSSKPYANKYYSLNGNYINNFGVCELSEDDKIFLYQQTDPHILDEFFRDKYGIVF